jgi:glycosyltransferase involved in cell wall biosynthesis
MGDFDATIVILSRVDPWVRESLGGGLRILDAVDSLRRNAEERGKAASKLMRGFWRREERRLARAETDVARAYDRIVVVNSDEKSDLGASAVAIGNGVRIAPLDLERPRRFDFGFWGRLAYFANADAAMWLIGEIWPAILERNPAASCVIAGADAPRSIRRAAAGRGITLLSPVDDLAVLARSVRVAIIPVRYGSGQLNKVIEAGEAGCAIVATRQSLRGLTPLIPFVRFARDAPSFAKAALELLETDEKTAMAGTLRRAVAANYSRERILGEMAKVAGVRNTAEAVTA